MAMTKDKDAAQASVRSSQEQGYPSPGYAWYLVLLLLIVYTFSFIDRQILGLLGPTIIAEFNLSDTEFGLLSGFGFALFYTTFGLICARMSDAGSRKGLIAVGLALWSIMTALSGLARSYWELFAFRIGVGVGEATLAPAANSILADSFPKEKLSTALSVYSMGIPVGSGLAFIVGGTVIGLADMLPDITIPGVGTLAGWQKTFMIVGLPGLLLTILVATLREPSRKGRVGDTASIPLRDVWTFMTTRKRAFLAVILGVSVNAAIGFGSLIWITIFMVRYHGLEAHDVGLTFGTIALIAGPAGLILLGRIADVRTEKGQKDGLITTLMIAPLGFFLPTLIFPFMESVTVAWVFLFFCQLFLSSPSGVAYAALQVITPNQMRGQIIAVYVLSINIIGYGGGAYLFGYLSDLLAGPYGADGLRYAYVIFGAVTGPLSFALYVWGRKAFARAVVEEEKRLAAQSAD